ERLRELNLVLPLLNATVISRGESHQADEQIRVLTREREKQLELVSIKEGELRQAKERRQILHNKIAHDEARNRELSAKLQTATLLVNKLGECERQENDLSRLRAEIAKLPADPLTLVQIEREKCERLEGLSREVPIVVRFQSRRNDLLRATEKMRYCEEEMT